MEIASTIIAGAAIAVISRLLLRRFSRANLLTPLLETLNREGPIAARRLVDQRLPAVADVSLLKMRVQSQKQRMAALCLLGDTNALRSELGTHRGLLTATLQVDGLALLCLALCDDDPVPYGAELATLAGRGMREGKLARLFAARLVGAFSEVVNSFSGTPLSPSARSLLEQGAMEGGMVETVIVRALHRGLMATGDTKAATKVEGRLKILPGGLVTPGNTTETS